MLTQHFISSTLVTLSTIKMHTYLDPNTSTSPLYLTTTIKARNFGHVSKSYEKMPSELYPGTYTLSFKNVFEQNCLKSNRNIFQTNTILKLIRKSYCWNGSFMQFKLHNTLIALKLVKWVLVLYGPNSQFAMNDE